jgi:cytochrome c553
MTGRIFRLCAGVALMAILAAVLSPAAQNQSGSKTPAPDPLPYWAYAVNPPATAADAKAEPTDTAPRHVPDSAAAFTVAQTQDMYQPPDWHPADHVVSQSMPGIVSQGRAPDVYACGYCHLPNGQGRPENASLAGLAAGYIVQQMADFKSGRRKSSEPKHLPTSAMIAVAAKANAKEIQDAAKYFSALKPRPWIRVVETDTVPKTHVAGWMLVASDPAGTELIGARIIEMPENLERTELRDDHSGFIAYVPPGSIKKGQALVATGGEGVTVRCANCHGPHLRGVGKVPRLAGRSPSYIVRQLYDIQKGTRAGVATQQMTSTVTKLTLDDMAAIAAYVASLKP